MPEVQFLYSEYSQLNKALLEADDAVPCNALEIIGKKFLFACYSGSHFYFLSGQVTSVQLFDTGGLELFVTTPYMGSERIRSLSYFENSWCVRTECGEHFNGIVEIID